MVSKVSKAGDEMSEAAAFVEDRGEEEMTREVTDFILQDILTGTLPPGTWLKQVDLERRYGCTRPEVRRALDRLSQKRLVEHVPNRGYHVFEPDGRRAREVGDIRVILETAVAGTIIARATGEAILRLRELARHFDQMTLTGTVLELYEANLAFHREILALSDNLELVNLITEIRQRTSSAPVSQWRTRARIEQSGREHHQMIDAIEAKATDEFKRLVEQHIRQP
jgi:DNA-binding GntR family transcriptional regulator